MSLSPATTHTVRFNAADDDLAAAFNAPLTEVLFHSLKDGMTKEDLDGAFSDMTAHLAANGVGIRLLHGDVLKSTGKFGFYTAIGWDGFEVGVCHTTITAIVINQWNAHPVY